MIATAIAIHTVRNENCGKFENIMIETKKCQCLTYAHTACRRKL
jgi:hypothetical protein